MKPLSPADLANPEQSSCAYIELSHPHHRSGLAVPQVQVAVWATRQELVLRWVGCQAPQLVCVTLFMETHTVTVQCHNDITSCWLNLRTTTGQKTLSSNPCRTKFLVDQLTQRGTMVVQQSCRTKFLADQLSQRGCLQNQRVRLVQELSLH